MSDRSINARDAIDIAWLTDPGNPFVASVARFYRLRGYLTIKQIAALNNVRPTYSRNRFVQ